MSRINFKTKQINNEEISNILYKLAKFSKENVFKARAYRNAANAIKETNIIITSGKQAQKSIKGVGKSISEKIDEILTTGSVSILQNMDIDVKRKDEALDLFMDIYGVGYKTAQKWVDSGYRTLEELKVLYPSFTQAQKFGYYYYNQLKLKIPREEIDLIKVKIENMLPNIKFEICGSYRRGLLESGDIDILINNNNNIDLKNIIYRLTEIGFLIGHLGKGDTKYLGICKLSDKHNARRIDMMLVDDSEYFYAILYFTGSQNLNIKMRQQALSKGMSLSEHGIVNISGSRNKHLVCSERDIFEIIGFDYLEPTERNL